MRGIVYRLARRRAGSMLVAIAVGVALAFAAGPFAAAATARARITPYQAGKTPIVAHPPAKPPSPVAHATGHKIA